MSTDDPKFDLGRKVFIAACSAAVDDFSQVTDEHLSAAIYYAGQQAVLWGSMKTTLRKLRLEQARRVLA